jgi:hypothetical protein
MEVTKLGMNNGLLPDLLKTTLVPRHEALGDSYQRASRHFRRRAPARRLRFRAGRALPPLYATRGGSSLPTRGALLRNPIRESQFYFGFCRPARNSLSRSANVLLYASFLRGSQCFEAFAALASREIRL